VDYSDQDYLLVRLPFGDEGPCGFTLLALQHLDVSLVHLDLLLIPAQPRLLSPPHA
jgi:hypothetical protein